ncbi:MAG TPA: HAMP domain-containing sensor histidine kinase [Pseudonocardiaceae bacterium]
MTWSSLGVLVVVLLMMLVAADVAFTSQSRRDLNARVVGKAVLAAQLARAGVAPAELVRRIQEPDVAVRLVTASGEVLGRAPDVAPRRGGGAPVFRRSLPGGSQITLVGDVSGISAAQQRLRRVLLLVGVLAAAVATTVLLASTRLALAPLDAMTALARSIAGGNRGRRLSPTRTDTELGRTASAFDDMLDALEGTERQAKASEARALASESRALASEARIRQFVADAAHELRTPLAGVQAAAQASVSPDLAEPERQRLHVLLVREAHRAGQLVEDLLALARLDAGQQPRREPVALVDLARAETERVRLLSPALQIVVGGVAVTVAADAQQVSQVLANLLDNARRHAAARIDVQVTREAGTAVVTVADDGPGIAEADRERVFDRLVRLDAARTQPDGVGTAQGASGAGLGLAIARGIARAHGGDLRCVPPASGAIGAVFRLELPG